MKKYLYGTTSLVGVGLLAGTSPVQAAPQPIHLELGGFFHQWQGYADSDFCFGNVGTAEDEDCIDGDIVQVGEIYFKIRGELDNGLEIGGRIELETQQDTDVIDAARVDIAGPFGHFQLGQEDSARHNWAFDTAANNEGILINSGWETAFAATSQATFGLLRPSHSTALDFSDKAPKVTYFTPRFAGFQLAASWTPDTQTDLGTLPVGNGSVVSTSAAGGGVNGSLRFGTANNDVTYTNAFDLGAHYTGELAGVGITAQAGWGTVSAPDNVDVAGFGIAGEDDSDPNIYQAGLALTFGGFRVAGGWARMDHGLQIGGGQRTDGHSWTLGGGYSTGPWAFSAGYLYGEEEGAIARRGKDENEFFQVSASYALSPGLGLNVQYLHIEREADVDGGPGSGSRDSITNALMMGVKVGF